MTPSWPASCGRGRAYHPGLLIHAAKGTGEAHRWSAQGVGLVATGSSEV